MNFTYLYQFMTATVFVCGRFGIIRNLWEKKQHVHTKSYNLPPGINNQKLYTHTAIWNTNYFNLAIAFQPNYKISIQIHHDIAS